MAVITIAARISTTPAIAPPTSAAMLTEGCAAEVGVGKEYIEEAVFRNELKFKWFELESSGWE